MDLATVSAADSVFDFEAIEDVQTAEVRIKDQNGLPTSMIVTLMGPEHPERKRVMMARQRRFRAEWSRTSKLPVVDPTDEYDEETADLVAFTIGWTGAKITFSREAAQRVYTDPKRQWLRVQVKKALDERERFLANSVQS